MGAVAGSLSSRPFCCEKDGPAGGIRVENKILVVTGDQDMQDLLVLGLSRGGFQVFAAGDGSSALFQVGLAQPDLIVLDLSQPGSDGWETLRRLRDLGSTPVIVLTSKEEEARIEGLRCGADHSVARPFSMRELCARIHALLRRAQGAMHNDPHP
jgi:DNA-binding response OmpR family regulator